MLQSLYTKTIALAVGGALCAAAVACDEDHKPDWPVQEAEAVALSSASVAEGAEIDAATTEISLVYDHAVALSTISPITLNGQNVATEVREGNTVIANVALAAGQAYKLHVPANAVAGVGTLTFAPELTVNFTTKAGAPAGPAEILGLVNANATEQARKVYDFIIQQHGKKILSGAMANVNNNNDFAGWIKTVTGKDVAIAGYDFIHLPESGQDWIDYSDISPAKEQWEANGLVSYMWHWRVPTDKEAYDSKDIARYGARTPGSDVEDPTEFDIREAVKEGTWQNEFILSDIDKVAAVLKQLQDEGIPVIWRPLHEASGSYKYSGAWFWWGRYGDEPTKQLWKLMYDRLVNHHGLNNLIWVWTAQYEEGYEAQMAASYPGNDFCDIVGTDIYADNDGSQKSAYDALVAMTGGKRLVTISETGLIQNPDKCFADGANWSWFNLWYTYDQHVSGGTTDGFGNTAESLKAVFDSEYVINRDQMPSFK